VAVEVKLSIRKDLREVVAICLSKLEWRIASMRGPEEGCLPGFQRCIVAAVLSIAGAEGNYAKYVLEEIACIHGLFEHPREGRERDRQTAATRLL
jgi:hypothetical protein